MAAKLKHRLADLRAASTIMDLVAGRPHELAGDDQPAIGIGLCDGYRLIIRPNHPGSSKKKAEGFDWAKVNRIKVHRIESCDG